MRATIWSPDNQDFLVKIRSKGVLIFRRKKSGSYFFKKTWTFRLPSPLENLLRSASISIIHGYQRHLSPKKGYSCAHRVLHSGDSCSEYVKKTLSDKSFFEVTLLAKQRFKECSVASMSLKSQVTDSKISAGPDFDVCGIIVSIVTAILALIFGRNNGCCR